MGDRISEALREAISPLRMDADDQVALVDRETVEAAAARIATLEAALREIDERAADAINEALAKKQGGLADEFVWIVDRIRAMESSDG